MPEHNCIRCHDRLEPCAKYPEVLRCGDCVLFYRSTDNGAVLHLCSPPGADALDAPQAAEVEPEAVAVPVGTRIVTPYLTAPEAAAYLKISESYLLRLAKDRKIEKIKVWGDGPRFTVEALDRFMSDRIVRAKKR